MAAEVKTVNDFFEDSKKLVGEPVYTPDSDPEEVGVTLDTADVRAIKHFGLAIGDGNPLYSDPAYAASNRFGCLIAHPHWIAQVRYTICRGAHEWGCYPISGLVAGFDWEWNDIIRVGDKFTSSFILDDVFQKTGRTGRLVFTKTLANYWNQHKELVATGHGHWIGVGREEATEGAAKGEGFRETMIYDRGTYHYSKEEIEEIVKGIKSEKRRGNVPRYWEEVKVGDKLIPIVKGPLTTSDLMGFHALQAGPSRPCFELAFLADSKLGSGVLRTNPLTGWPYEHFWMEHYDWHLVKGRGLPAPFDVGCFRACAASHLLSNWMGDDGFIRRVYVQFRKPNYYGDTTWFNAEVVRTYKDKVGDEEYGAVDIRIMGTNQIGETSAPGTATVYLPSRGKPVKLPIPHEDKYEEYEAYLKACEHLRRTPRKLFT